MRLFGEAKRVMIRRMVQRPSQHKDFGVFLRVANGGWIVFKTTPALDALYVQNRAAAVLADPAGLSIVAGADKAQFDQMSAWDDSPSHDLDGPMLIFPDHVEGLAMFGSEIPPSLRTTFS